MARARGIKPGFFTDAEVIELTFEARLLFIGLWCLADREGRLKDRPKQIKMELFPADDVDVNIGLTALASRGLIVRYSVAGDNLIEVPNFAKHQHPHHQEKPSDLPGPEGADAEPADPTREAPPVTLKKPKRKPSEPAAGFEEFWSGYPKKDGKADAIAAWNRIAPDADLVARIVADVRRRSAGEDWRREQGRYIPLPATYLNAKRWEDEGVVPTGGTADPEEEYLRANGRRIKEMMNQ